MKNITFAFIWILIVKNLTKCQISIYPKNNVLQGEKLNISCKFQSPRELVMWYHNSITVAESNRPYGDKGPPIEIFHVGMRYDLIIRNATLSHRGLWKCDEYGVQLNVSVPWALQAIQVKKLPTRTASGRVVNDTYDVIENGHRLLPYDLRKNGSVEIICRSDCGFPAPQSITIQYRNSTNTGELSGGTQKNEQCLHDKRLQKITHTITINCQSHNLVSRNEIRCQSQDVNRNSISNRPVFILCPGRQTDIQTDRPTDNGNKPDTLTNGEKIAIGISIVLAIVDVIIIVFLLRRNCRELSEGNISHYKFDKSHGSEVML